MIRNLLTALAALLLAACGSNVRSYDLPLAELKQRVSEVETSSIMLQSRGVSTDRIVEDDKVSWKVSWNGTEVLRIIAAMAATGDSSSTLALTLEPSARMKAQQAKNPDGVESIKNLYLIAQDEQIAAHLEHRSLDMGRIMAATMRATMANSQHIFGDPDRSVEASQAEDRANVDAAYANSGQ